MSAECCEDRGTIRCHDSMEGNRGMTSERNGATTGTDTQHQALSTQHSRAQRVILVVWDGMRPDLVGAELTPNLHAFAERGAWYRRAVGVFPSVTRPTTSSV